MKPNNPYKKGSLIWSVMEGDWYDLTTKQIGEVLGTGPCTIRAKISKIKKDTGYDVPHIKGIQNHSVFETLKNNDWSNYTVNEIASILGISPGTVYVYIDKIKSETGIEVRHKRSKRG